MNEFSYTNFILFLDNPWNWAMLVATVFCLLFAILAITACRLSERDLVETTTLNTQLETLVDELAGTKYQLEAENTNLRRANAQHMNHPVIRSKEEFDAIISQLDEPLPTIDDELDRALIIGNSWRRAC